MSHEDLKARIEKRPFIPFRIVLTEGTAYEIRHPELFMLGRRSVIVGLARKPDQKHYDRATTIDLLHVMRTEPLEVPAPGNGESPA